MTRLIPYLVMILPLAFASCHHAEDIIDSFDKVSHQSYLRNESGRDVMVIMRPSRHRAESECTWFVAKDSVVEIPDTERWGLMQRVYESDTVFFCYADGTRLLHYYTTERYPSDSHLFVPQEHNIFSTGLNIPETQDTWTLIRTRPQRYRYEYVIR